MTTRTILAFDFGHKRIGVAVCQELGRTARALATLPVRNGRLDWNAVAAIVGEWLPQLFVVGLPTTADGERHALAPDIERFARRLSGRFRVPVEFVDERLSSYAAAGDAEMQRAGLDAVAARCILESWFAGH